MTDIRESSEASHMLSASTESMNPADSHKMYYSTDNDCSTKTTSTTVAETTSVETVKKDEAQGISFKNLPRRSKVLLLICSVANFASCLSYAVPSPFYPQEAEEKGLSQEMIGFFFSVYEVIVFITSPVFGLYLSKIGPRFLLLSGILVSGAGSIIFGYLGQSPPGDDFLILSLFNRGLIAIGYSAFVTSMQVIVLNEVPGNEGLAFVEQKGQPSVFCILKSPLVWISLPTITVCSIGMGFLDPTLAKHLEPFDLSTGVIGLFFLIASTVYCVFTPVWGWLSDSKKIGQGPLLVTGAISTGLAFLILGPSPWLGFLPFEIWTVTIGLVLLGMSQPGGMIPPIKCLTNAAVESGLEDNIDTYGMVVGLYNFAYCLGAAGGPLLAGFLVDHYGFSTGVNIVSSTNFAMAAICLVYFTTRYKTKKKKSYDLLQESYQQQQQYHKKI